MKTNIYHKDTLVRSEKLISFEEYVSYGRLKAGQFILIGKVINNQSSDTEKIIVGNCTETLSIKNDGKGWSKEDCGTKFVIEVHTYH